MTKKDTIYSDNKCCTFFEWKFSILEKDKVNAYCQAVQQEGAIGRMASCLGLKVEHINVIKNKTSQNIMKKVLSHE